MLSFGASSPHPESPPAGTHFHLLPNLSPSKWHSRYPDRPTISLCSLRGGVSPSTTAHPGSRTTLPWSPHRMSHPAFSSSARMSSHPPLQLHSAPGPALLETPPASRPPSSPWFHGGLLKTHLWATCVDLEIVILTEVSQTEKEKYHMMYLRCEV